MVCSFKLQFLYTSAFIITKMMLVILIPFSSSGFGVLFGGFLNNKFELLRTDTHYAKLWSLLNILVVFGILYTNYDTIFIMKVCSFIKMNLIPSFFSLSKLLNQLKVYWIAYFDIRTSNSWCTPTDSQAFWTLETLIINLQDLTSRWIVGKIYIFINDWIRIFVYLQLSLLFILFINL